MKRKLALIFALALIAVTLLGCGSSQNGWKYIKDKDILIVGLDDTFAPMGFRDEAGQLVGFDIDMANEVSEILGVKVEFKPIVWDTKEMELSAKRVDCLWNGMSATPARQGSMALTDKYLNNQLMVAVLDPEVKIATVNDLADYKIGTQADSAAFEVMEEHDDYGLFKDNISLYDDYDLAILDMQAGRIDCIVVDKVLADYKNTKMDVQMEYCEFNFGDDYFAIGCRKEDTDVAKKITDALKTLIDNGTAAEISEKWFGSNIVIMQGY